MSTPLASLRDRSCPQLWSIFEWITTFPRPSGAEQPFRDALINRAVSHGWAVRRDAIGNVVFAVDGVGDLANEPVLVLQGHLDMVCEKNHNVSHDFLHDPIPAYVDGDWIRSRGTTLGADNGIAIALALALAEADVDHRLPLELLFTIEEETGLIGACARHRHRPQDLESG
jgi:dipeptidase D